MKAKTAKLFVFVFTAVSILFVSNAMAQTLPFTEEFTDNTIGEMSSYSVTGDQQWGTNSFGAPAPCGYISGYEGGNFENEDWLITPGIDFSSISGAILSFDEAINYTGSVDNEQEIYVSTDYSGSGDPTVATWTKLNFTGRSTGDNWDWYTVDSYDLSEYIGESTVFIGFKYSSTSSNAGTWEIDNISIEEGSLSTSPQITNIVLNPAQPTSSDAVSISATITDADGSISSATLSWGESVFGLTSINMVVESGDTWVTEAAIPAHAVDVQIIYKIVAIDDEANETVTGFLSYFVNDPFNGEFPFYEPFNTDLGEMSGISVIGDQVWHFDQYAGNGYAEMSGYSDGNNANEDWLITPMLDFSNLTEAKLVFREAINYATIIEDEMEVYISTDYIDDVSLATWTELAVNGRAPGDSWTVVEVDTVNLLNYIGEPSVYIGFKYTSTITSSATWNIHDIKVEATTNPNAPNINNIVVTPESPTSSDPISISADVIDNQADLSSVTLNWGTVSGELSSSINLSVTTGDTYITDTDIPTQTSGTTVYYKVVAEDAEGNVATTGEMFVDVIDYGTTLAITNISPAEPFVGEEITIEVEVQNDEGNASIVDQNTEIQINLASGTGNLSGTVTGIINNGSDNVLISGVIYNVGETFEINASVISGMSLTTSADVSVISQTPLIVSLPYSEDFVDNTFGDLNTYNVSGDQVWVINDYGNPQPAANITGFAGGNNLNEDWMITPGIDLSGITEAKLVFDEAINFSNVIEDEQEVFVSTDYLGNGNVSEATWIELSVTGRSGGISNDFVTVNDIDLTTYAGETQVFIAFKYSSSETYSANWKIDNILIEEGATAIAPVIESIINTPTLPTSADVVSVSAEIIDIDGSISSAVLHWGLTNSFGNEIAMSLSSGNTWVTQSDLPAQNANDTIYYKIIAEDDDLIVTESEILSYMVFDPYSGELPFYEPFYFGLGVMEQISISGEQIWYGEGLGGFEFASISGYANGNSEANQDWLITPLIDLSEVTTAALNYREAINLTSDINIVVDDTHEVFISTDYAGDPITASWSELAITGRDPQESGWLWVDVDEVSLDEYAGESSVYIAFRYQSTDTTNSTWEIDDISITGAVGIAGANLNNLSIYPNPAQNEVFVTGVENISNVQIIGLDGKVVMSEQTNNNRIDVSSVNDGMYILRVISGNEVYTTRFVKK